jgi:hypothetical protein
VPNLISLSTELGPQLIDMALLTGAAPANSPVFVTQVTMPDGVVYPTVAPTTGQVITATSPTAAAWQTPGGGGGATKTVRSGITSFTQGGVVGPITLSFATPFADNNYTVSVTVIGDETAPGTPTITQFPSVGVSYVKLQASGAGVVVWVANNDSIAHSGIISVIGIHD